MFFMFQSLLLIERDIRISPSSSGDSSLKICVGNKSDDMKNHPYFTKYPDLEVCTMMFTGKDTNAGTSHSPNTVNDIAHVRINV